MHGQLLTVALLASAMLGFNIALLASAWIRGELRRNR